MQRRSFLTSLAAVTAGCASRGSPGTSTSPTTTVSTHDTTATTPRETTTTQGTTFRPSWTPGVIRISDLVVGSSYDRPESRFVLEPRAFYSADAVAREREASNETIVVRDVSSIADPAVRTAVETAIRSGQWTANRTPSGLNETVEHVDFFTGVAAEGGYTHVGLELYDTHPSRPPAVSFEARVVDDRVTPDDPGTVVLGLRNGSDVEQHVFSGTVPPFGTVFARGDPGRFLLWRPYESAGCINIQDDGILTCAIGIETALAPGEAIGRRYAVLHPTTSTHPTYTAPPGPGRYRARGSVSYTSTSGAPSTKLQYEVAFSLSTSE